MRRPRGSIQGLLWTIACALVLKSAVPLLAAGAAHLQGVPVGSICGIYGVTLPGAKADPHAGHHGHHGHQPDGSAPDDAPEHAHNDRNHCALTGLAAMAVPAMVAATVHIPTPFIEPQRALERRCAADACKAWAARMQHPPPARA
jgi:hypothetical protein